MKEKKHRKYESPTVSKTLLEAEGIFCQSLRMGVNVDELNQMNSSDTTEPDPMYFDL